MALITRWGTDRFRCCCQKMDPGGVWCRMEPRGKALQRNKGETESEFFFKRLIHLYPYLLPWIRVKLKL